MWKKSNYWILVIFLWHNLSLKMLWHLPPKGEGLASSGSVSVTEKCLGVRPLTPKTDGWGRQPGGWGGRGCANALNDSCQRTAWRAGHSPEDVRGVCHFIMPAVTLVLWGCNPDHEAPNILMLYLLRFLSYDDASIPTPLPLPMAPCLCGPADSSCFGPNGLLVHTGVLYGTATVPLSFQHLMSLIHNARLERVSTVTRAMGILEAH